MATSIKSKKDKTEEELICGNILIDIKLDDDEDNEDDEETPSLSKKSSEVEDILFRLPHVKEPLIGTPKQIQSKLDKIAIAIRRHPEKNYENQLLFDKIHLYMHGFLINVALKQFPYIKGLQTVDIYQEALIALRFKAINGFRQGKGMSFLNFAKMCIRRHLITLLNSSKTRLKDQSINQAISLDSTYGNNEDGQTLANTIPEKGDSVDKQTEDSEAYLVTLKSLCNLLSPFEQEVLYEYLTSSSYNEIADDVSDRKGKINPTKSVDNALVRIRTKAKKLKEIGKLDEIPLFIL